MCGQTYGDPILLTHIMNLVADSQYDNSLPWKSIWRSKAPVEVAYHVWLATKTQLDTGKSTFMEFIQKPSIICFCIALCCLTAAGPIFKHAEIKWIC